MLGAGLAKVEKAVPAFKVPTVYAGDKTYRQVSAPRVKDAVGEASSFPVRLKAH